MTVFIYSLKRLMKEKSSFIFMLVVPIAFILLTMLLSTNNTSSYRVGLVDYDNTPLTQAFKESLSQRATIVDMTEGELQNKLINSNIQYGIVIPKGFTEEIISLGDTKLNGYRIMESDAAVPTMFFIENFINSSKHIAKAAKGDNVKFYEGITAYLNGVNIIKSTTLSNKNGAKEITLAGIGFLLMSMLYFSISTASIVLEDKKNKTFFRTLSSPLTMRSYMLQNLLCYLLLQQLQIIVIFSIMGFVFNMNLGPSLINLFFIMFVFSIVCVAFGTALATISKDTRQASVLATFIVNPMVMIGGCFWPIEIMPQFLQKLSNLMPTKWALDGIEAILFGESVLSISKEIFILGLFSLVFFLLGTWRKKDIML